MILCLFICIQSTPKVNCYTASEKRLIDSHWTLIYHSEANVYLNNLLLLFAVYIFLHNQRSNWTVIKHLKNRWSTIIERLFNIVRRTSFWTAILCYINICTHVLNRLKEQSANINCMLQWTVAANIYLALCGERSFEQLIAVFCCLHIFANQRSKQTVIQHSKNR